jgi:hypothetical protein
MSGAAARPRTKPSPSGDGRVRVPQPLWSGRTDDGSTLTPTLSRRERGQEGIPKQWLNCAP